MAEMLQIDKYPKLCLHLYSTNPLQLVSGVGVVEHDLAVFTDSYDVYDLGTPPLGLYS